MQRVVSWTGEVARTARVVACPRGVLALLLASASAAFAPAASAEAERGADRDRAVVQPMQLTANVGAESTDEAIQALAFLPNDVTVDVGDTVTWDFPTHEPHTLTFLQPGQTRPSAGAAAVTPTGSTFDGRAFFNSGVLVGGQSYSMTFADAGDFSFVCLIHARMSGTLHVEASGTRRDSDRGDLSRVGRADGRELLREGERLRRDELAAVIRDTDDVTIGRGFVRTTPAGDQSVMIARFLPAVREARVGESIEWTSTDPATPHTVTFGPAPGSPAAIVNVTSGNAVLPTTPPGATVSSGFLGAPFANEHFSATFNAPGTYEYYCALHRDLGMRGTIVVR